jgi:hypothetical protein
VTIYSLLQAFASAKLILRAQPSQNSTARVSKGSTSVRPDCASTRTTHSRRGFCSSPRLTSWPAFTISAECLAGRGVGADFRRFARKELRSFVSGDLTQRLFDDFRNGLSHELRIKNGGEFSFDRPQTVRHLNGRLCINPAHLLLEVEEALARQTAELTHNVAKRVALAERLRILFEKEFGIIERVRRAG